MSTSGATPAASRLAIGARSLARDQVAASERVSFPELVWSHFLYQRELHEQGLQHGPAETEFRSQLERFVAEQGPIINAYWCTTEASGVALTERKGDRVLGFLWRRAPDIRFHSATDWATHDAPAVNHVMHTTETLAIRVSEVLSKTPERIAMQWLLSVAGYLLSVVDVEGRPNKNEATRAARSARAELTKVETYYDRAGEKTARLIYFWGMMIGIGALIVLAVAGAWVYSLFGAFHLKDPATKTFFVCYGMGAVGAIVSVLTRMSQTGDEAFLDYEVGRPAIRRVGSFRPVIGAVFAVVLYFALRSGLVQLTTTSAGANNGADDTFGGDDQIYFYAALAFIAGFSERKARVLLGGATKILGDGDDEHAPDKPPQPQKKPAEGSTA
jgi:hypothetical protein